MLDLFEFEAMASMQLGPRGTVTAAGLIEVTDYGRIGAFQLAVNMELGVLRFFGFASLELKTYSTPQPVARYYDASTKQVIPVTEAPEMVNIDPNTLQVFIGGEWVKGTSYAPNVNPSNLADSVAEYARADKNHAEDAIQALGAFPLDVKKTPVDFLAADGHKWLLGPEGAGVLFVRREHLDLLRPLGVGWKSVVHSHDFTRIELVLKDAAERYEGGSPNTAGFIGLGCMGMGYPRNTVKRRKEVRDGRNNGLRGLPPAVSVNGKDD